MAIDTAGTFFHNFLLILIGLGNAICNRRLHFFSFEETVIMLHIWIIGGIPCGKTAVIQYHTYNLYLFPYILHTMHSNRKTFYRDTFNSDLTIPNPLQFILSLFRNIQHSSITHWHYFPTLVYYSKLEGSSLITHAYVSPSSTVCYKDFTRYRLGTLLPGEHQSLSK